MRNKSTVEQIRERFDNDVERFSSLEAGHVAAVDSTLSLELVTESARRLCPEAEELLDIGCGAGNFTLKMLSKLPGLNCTLLDLSKPMLEKAEQRVAPATKGRVKTLQGDIRETELAEDFYDIVLAGAVLHHLRDDAEWNLVFSKLYRIIKPGGCLVVSDLMTQESEVLNGYFGERYFEYLSLAGGDEYAKKVFDCIAQEDTPRSVAYQMELMKNVGFRMVDILHKNICFAAICAVK